MTDATPGPGPEPPSPPRLRTRPWRDADVPRVVEACRDEQTRRWLGELSADYGERDARAYLAAAERRTASGAGWFVAVTPDDDDRVVAELHVRGLDLGDGDTGNVGYWVHPDARGRGVARAAIRLAAAHAFTARADGGLGLRRLVLRVAAGNDASARAALAAGFTETGRQRQAARIGDGSYADLRDFDLLAGDPSAPPGPARARLPR